MWVLRCALVLAALAGMTGPVPQAAPLDKLSWLGGCWELRRGPRVTVEMWMSPAGGMMLGASRSVVNGALGEWEQLRLSLRGDTVIYTALPSGQNQTEFKTMSVSDSGFVVENLSHDFPQRIIYRKRGADSLVTRIEGPGRGIDFPMTRVRCTRE